MFALRLAWVAECAGTHKLTTCSEDGLTELPIQCGTSINRWFDKTLQAIANAILKAARLSVCARTCVVLCCAVRVRVRVLCFPVCAVCVRVVCARARARASARVTRLARRCARAATDLTDAPLACEAKRAAVSRSPRVGSVGSAEVAYSSAGY